MSNPISLMDIIKVENPDMWAGHLAYTVEMMIGTVRIALLNEVIDGELKEHREYMAEQTLEVAQALAHAAGQGCEMLEARRRRDSDGRQSITET